MKIEKVFQFFLIFAFCLIAVWFMTDKNPVSYEEDSIQRDSVIEERVKVVPDSSLIIKLDSLENLLNQERQKPPKIHTQKIKIYDTVYVDSFKQLTKERNYSFNFDSLGFSIGLKASLTQKKDDININLYPYDIWMLKRTIYKTVIRKDKRLRIGYGFLLRKKSNRGYSVGVSGIISKNRYSVIMGIENEGMFLGISKYLR